MGNILIIVEVVLAILLTVCILMQHQGTGLGGAFGGEGNVYRSRRGAEKALFVLTIILAVAFASVALISIVVK